MRQEAAVLTVEMGVVLSASAEMSYIKLPNFCNDELLSDRPCALQCFKVHRKFFPKHLYNIVTVSEFCNLKNAVFQAILKQVRVCIHHYGQRL